MLNRLHIISIGITSTHQHIKVKIAVLTGRGEMHSESRQIFKNKTKQNQILEHRASAVCIWVYLIMQFAYTE